MTGESSRPAAEPVPGDRHDVPSGAGPGGGDLAPVSSTAPRTGDGQVDAVLERLRVELAGLGDDDLGGRRAVLAGADGALRELLESASDVGSSSEVEPPFGDGSRSGVDHATPDGRSGGPD